MSIEAGVLVDEENQPIFWHRPAEASVGYLPDSRQLWDTIWSNRHRVLGFAHSHPGRGTPSPSWEDLSTFDAVEKALGKRLVWWVISQDQVLMVLWNGKAYQGYLAPEDVELPWLYELRRVSYQEGA